MHRHRRWSAFALILLEACNANAGHRGATAPVSAQRVQPERRNYRTFWSRETQGVAVQEIFGDSAAPWVVPPKRMTLVFNEPSKASILLRLVKTHTLLPRAVIDDAADGEYWTLESVRGTKYETRHEAYSTLPFPTVTFTIGRAHFKCGPPTCLQPTQY